MLVFCDLQLRFCNTPYTNLVVVWRAFKCNLPFINWLLMIFITELKISDMDEWMDSADDSSESEEDKEKDKDDSDSKESKKKAKAKKGKIMPRITYT